MARRATFIDSVRAENPNTLVFDGGDFSDLNPTYGPLKNDFTVKMLKRLGYDGMTLGERDLPWGADHYHQMTGGEPALLMNNVVRVSGDKREPFGDGVLVRDLGGVKVGAFGLVHEAILARGREAARDLVAEDVFESSDRIVRRLSEEGCDVIVLVAQMELAFADSVIRRNPDIDVVILGHKGGMRTTHSMVNETIVVRPGRRGQYIGALDLTVSPTGEIVDHGGSTIALDGKFKKDQTVLALVNEMKAQIDRLRKEANVITQTEYQNQQEVDRYLGAAACARCHQPEFEQWNATGHAHAYDTLVDLGMDGQDECVSCHVTGFGERTGFASLQIKPDLTQVQCESCHQMGTLHAVGAANDHVAAATCEGCHDPDNSPDFQLESYLERIRHW